RPPSARGVRRRAACSRGFGWGPVAAIVAADNPLVAALEDADHSAFCATPAVLTDGRALDADDHTGAGHGFIEMGAPDVDIAAGLDWTLGRYEPVPSGMRL